MNTKNKQRAKLALAELEREMEVLTTEEASTCKGGYHYGEALFVPVSGIEGSGGSGGGGNSILGGSGTDDDPYQLSEVVVTAPAPSTRNNSSNFGGSIFYTGGSGGYNPHRRTGPYGPIPSQKNDHRYPSPKNNNSFGDGYSFIGDGSQVYGPQLFTGGVGGGSYGGGSYGGGSYGGGYSPSTPSSYDKFNITTIDYINVFGLGLSKIKIQSPINAKTGFWDYKIEADLSVGMSAGKSRLVIELMSATQGDINFKLNPKAGSLAELFNRTGKITTFSISALLKYTRVHAYDHSGKLMWSSNAFGGGIATEGISTSESNIEFKATTMSQADSIIRAVFDNTIPGWQEYLEGRNISEDSIQKIKSNPELWRLINAMKSEK